LDEWLAVKDLFTTDSLGADVLNQLYQTYDIFQYLKTDECSATSIQIPEGRLLISHHDLITL